MPTIGKLKYQRQRDAMHCGVASLSMLCSLYGRKPDISHLEQLCTPTNQGVSLMGIISVAQSLGLKATGVRSTVEGLREHLYNLNENTTFVRRLVAATGSLELVAATNSLKLVACTKIAERCRPCFLFGLPAMLSV